MPSVLICGPDPLTDELHDTLLWREGVERRVATGFEDALTIAVAAHPDLVVVDGQVPRADRLVQDLRRDPATRRTSIVVVARGAFEPAEIRFLEVGANAILRLPAGPDWDERLAPLMRVPGRRALRAPVRLQFEGRTPPGIETQWGAVLNLSQTGMLVETEKPPAVGTDLDFSFQLPSEAALVVGTGQVVRHSARAFGVRFYGLEGDGLERVARFVEAQEAASDP